MANTVDSLRLLEDKLDRAISRARTTQMITLVVGVLLIILLLAYFLWMSAKVREAATPESLAETAVGLSVTRVESLSDNADAFVKQDAPLLIRSFMKDASERHIPEMRRQLETEIKRRSTESLDKYEKEVYTGVDQFLQQYSTHMKDLAAQLKTPEGTQAFEDSLVALMEESIANEQIQADILAYGVALQQIDDLLDRVANNEADLTEEEKALQYLVAVIRETMNRSELNKVNLRESLNVGKETIAAGDSESAEDAPSAGEKEASASTKKDAQAKPDTQAKGGAGSK